MNMSIILLLKTQSDCGEFHLGTQNLCDWCRVRC